MLRALDNGDQINTTTDGSKIDSGEASAGWLFWMNESSGNEEDDAASDDADVDDSMVGRVCLLCGTILADGRYTDNTSFRAEAMGKLTVTILLQCLYDFLGRRPTTPTLHTCDNLALVRRVNNIRDNN